MSEYRRFIAYIYEYQRGIKRANCGYVKVEVRNGICRLCLHLRPGRKLSGSLQVYGFVRAADRILGLPLGAAPLRNSACEFQISMPAAGIGDTAYSLSDLRGIWLKNGTDENYISVWDEEPVAVEQFTTELPGEIPGEEHADAEAEPEPQPAGGGEAVRDMRPDITAAQEPGSLAQRWEKFLYHYPQMQPFSDDEITQCIRIAPKDISFLKREEWQFSQNTFLRQAYMRYRHLMLGRHENGRFVLAVPGTCENPQEKHLARMYGFPFFKEAAEQPFGYWYHFISEK